LLAWRLPDLRSENALDGAVSRESGFLVNNLVFVGAAIAILWGTLLPLATDALGRGRLQLGPPFFNRVMSPIGALLLVLAAVGPLLPWRRGTWRALARRMARPASIAALAGAAMLATTRHGAFAGIVTLGVLVAGVSASEIASAVRARTHSTGESRARAFAGTLARNPRRYGGYLVHLGIAIMVVGFAGSLFRAQADVVLEPGERYRFAGYSILYRDLRHHAAPDKDVRLAVLDVFSGGRRVAELHPQQNLHANFDQPQSEIAIRTTPARDLYVILTGTKDGSKRAAFRLYSNPLVFWVWAGAVVAVAGGLVALVARPRAGARPQGAPAGQAREVAASAP
jgi:cytochrome c-type biogenesis protein CcmF